MQQARLRPIQADLRRSAAPTAAGGPPLTARRHAQLACTPAALQAADVDATLSAAAGMMPALVWLAARQPCDLAVACKQAAPADGHHTAVHPWRDGHPSSRPPRAHISSARRRLRARSCFAARYLPDGSRPTRWNQRRPLATLAGMQTRYPLNSLTGGSYRSLPVGSSLPREWRVGLGDDGLGEDGARADQARG